METSSGASRLIALSRWMTVASELSSKTDLEPWTVVLVEEPLMRMFLDFEI